MRRCRTCKHWKTEGHGEWNEILWPTDPDTMKPMDLPFEVKACQHPELLFCERPLRSDGFAVAAGSEYMATFYTAENFGCVLWGAV